MSEDRIKALEETVEALTGRVQVLEDWQEAFVRRSMAMKAQAEADLARMQPPFAEDRYRP